MRRKFRTRRALGSALGGGVLRGGSFRVTSRRALCGGLGVVGRAYVGGIRRMIVLGTMTDGDTMELSRVISDEVPLHMPSALNARVYSAEVTKNVENVFSGRRYSPSVNRKLGLMKQDRIHNIFGCGDYMKVVRTDIPLVNIGGEGKMRKRCVYFTHPMAQKMMLDNLATQRDVDCGLIIAPIQAQANCWFNTMFVTFFISDMGRKFFQYFRAMMILGVKAPLIDFGKDGATLDAVKFVKESLGTWPSHLKLPNELHRAFFLLNYAIEACITGNDVALSLNTNVIILEIHDAITKRVGSMEAKRLNISKPGLDQLGDPWLYYTSIMNYLSDNTIRFWEIEMTEDNGDDFDFYGDIVDRLSDKEVEKIPHMIYVQLIQSMKNNIHTNGVSIPRVINATLDDGLRVSYELDSGLLNDNNRNEHVTCVLTCNGKGYAYDGQSFTRLVSCDWKNDLLNEPVDYKFETTPTCSYSFDGKFVSFLYYRVR